MKSAFNSLPTLLILLLGICGLSFAQTYVLRSVVLDGGGGRVTSSGYAVGLSAGQSFASPWLTGTGYRAIIGFWHGPYGASAVSDDRTSNTAARPEFGLASCRPNPFQRATIIAYSLNTEGRVDLRVYDRTGKAVGTLVSTQQSAGSYHVTWDIGRVPATMLPNGVYFLSLIAGGRRAFGKVVINR